MLPTILPRRWAAIDFETTGLNPWRGDRIFSAAATLDNGEQFFWRGEWSGLRTLLADESVDKVFHNLKYDWRMADFSGFKIRGRLWDTMIFGHLLDARQPLGLADMSKRYLPSDQRKVVAEIENWFDENKIGSKERYEKFGILPPEMLKKRNVGDTALTAGIFRRVYSTVARTFPLLLEQEHRLLPVVKRMEDRGCSIDYDEIELQIERFDAIVQDVTSFLEGVVGRNEFNLNSPTDQREALEIAGIYGAIEGRTEPSKTYPKGQPKMDDWNLRNLHHPVSHMMLLGKAAMKMRDTFLYQMARCSTNGVLHPNYNQLGTVSGRFSCTKPNLQNIPIEGDRRTSYTAEEAAEMFELTQTEYAPHLKRIFCVRPGMAHIHSDKKQAEMAMVAHYTGDPKLIGIFDSGQNFHEGVCRLLYGEMNKGLKTRTKAVVFGFIYGASNATLARKIGSDLATAKATRKKLAISLPSLPRWNRQLVEQVAQRGYVETIHGRRHYLKQEEGYIAVNRLCQGTVADEIKSRMVAIDDYTESELKGTGAGLVLNIHDDLATQVQVEDRHKAVPEIHRIMHEAGVPYKLSLPSSLDITYTRWSHLQEVEDIHNIPEPEDGPYQKVTSLTRSISGKSGVRST